MPTLPVTTSQADPAVRVSSAVLQRLASGYRPRDFAVRYWDGTTEDPDTDVPPAFTLVLTHPGAVRRMFRSADGLSFGEAFIHGDFDVEGDILAFLRFTRHLQELRPSFGTKLRLAAQILRLPAGGNPRVGHAPAKLSGRKRSAVRDRQAIGYAYDTSNDFYRLWLDASLLYTCAYFRTPDDTLDAAQRQKLDHVCRKLRLRPGERLLDIGCGWGGLVVHAAKHYGVEAVGVTLSRAQVAGAAEQIRAAGVEDRCRVEYRDYRDAAALGAFDKVACVGMLEHLGEAMMPTFFRGAWDALKPGGVFLNHGITRSAVVPLQRWRQFARTYVFPDGELETIGTAIHHAEAAGFEVRDVESLREHYALTLTHWLRRLEAKHAEAVKLVGEATYRVFRLYLAGSQNGMRLGVYNLHQTLFAKPKDGVTGLPLTRADWYH